MAQPDQPEEADNADLSVDLFGRPVMPNAYGVSLEAIREAVRRINSGAISIAPKEPSYGVFIGNSRYPVHGDLYSTVGAAKTAIYSKLSELLRLGILPVEALNRADAALFYGPDRDLADHLWAVQQALRYVTGVKKRLVKDLLAEGSLRIGVVNKVEAESQGITS